MTTLIKFCFNISGMIELLVKFCFVVFNIALVPASPNKFTLELLQVFFRHGDRYPSKWELSHIKSDSTPEKLSIKNYQQLTEVGMMREYKIGKMLRDRYDNFLGDYKYDEVYARSTDYDRTKMSLQLVLAGLYPQNPETNWNSKLSWRPFPAEVRPTNMDFLRILFDSPCMEYGKLLYKAQKSVQIVEKMKEHIVLFNNLKKRGAIKTTDFATGFALYSYITSILSLGYPLPDWCSEEEFKEIVKAASIFFNAYSITPEIRKANVGPMIDQLLQNIKDNENDGRKIYLYAGHETNIGPFTRAHNFTGIPPVPHYGSTVIIEKLRGSDDKIYLRMFYWTGVSEELIPVKIPSCDCECLLEDYVAAVEPMIPNEKEKSCYSPANFCKEYGKDI